MPLLIFYNFNILEALISEFDESKKYYISFFTRNLCIYSMHIFYVYMFSYSKKKEKKNIAIYWSIVVLLSRNIPNISNKFFLLLIAFMCMSCKKLFSFSLLTPPFSTRNNKIQSSLTFFLSSSLPIFSMLAYFIKTLSFWFLYKWLTYIPEVIRLISLYLLFYSLLFIYWPISTKI